MAIWDKVRKKVEDNTIKNDALEMATIPDNKFEPISYRETPQKKQTVGVMPELAECEYQLKFIEEQLIVLSKERESLDLNINKQLILKRMYEYALAYHRGERIFVPTNNDGQQTG